MEAYNDRYYTTGVTYQADNQPTSPPRSWAPASTSASLPIIGLGGTHRLGRPRLRPDRRNGVDPQNGGIVGSITLRHHPQRARPAVRRRRGLAARRPGHPGRALRPRRLRHRRRRAVRRRRATTSSPPDGPTPTGTLLNTLPVRDTGAAHRLHGPRRGRQPARPRRRRGRARPGPGDRTASCLAGAAQGVQFGPYPTDQGTPDANFGATVDGNYGFGDGCFDGTLDADRPGEPACCDRRRVHRRSAPATTSSASTSRTTRRGRPDVQGHRRGGHQHRQRRPVRPAGPAAVVRRRPAHRRRRRHRHRRLRRASATARRRPGVVTVPGLDAGAQPDLRRHRRLAVRGHGPPAVRHQARRRSATASRSCRCSTSSPTSRCPVAPARPDRRRPQLLRPTPSRIDCSARRPACPFAPVGIYDFTNRLVTTAESDYNGFYDVLLPSTNHISCPTPSGVCTEHVPLRGQRPGRPGPPQPELQPALPRRSPPSSRRCRA